MTSRSVNHTVAINIEKHMEELLKKVAIARPLSSIDLLYQNKWNSLTATRPTSAIRTLLAVFAEELTRSALFYQLHVQPWTFCGTSGIRIRY